MGRKNEAARSEPVAPAMLRMASMIVDTIAQRKGPVMPPVPKSVPRCLLGAKSGSLLERLATMNSDKVDFAAKVSPRPTPFATETDPARKEETTRVGSCEKSTKPASGEAAEICVLLKLDLLEDMDTCANKAAKEVAKTMAAEAYSLAEEIKRLDSELVTLKGSNISAPTSLQLEIACHEIVDLKIRLDVIQVKYESAKNEIGCYIPQIQDLEFTVYELRFVAYANDEELIAAYNQTSIGEVVGEVSAQAGPIGGEALDAAAAKNVTAAEGVATE
ncbi:hypothetical protein ACFX19_015490 [Malus domestica]